MKIINIILILTISIFSSGCYLGTNDYETFTRLNNSLIEKKISMINSKLAYKKESYNEEEYIYIRDYNKIDNIPKECIFGFITKKEDPKQILIRWEIISGKEYCKEQQKWIFSF